MGSLIKGTKELLGDSRDEETTEEICTIMYFFLWSILMTCFRRNMLQYQQMCYHLHLHVSIKTNKSQEELQQRYSTLHIYIATLCLRLIIKRERKKNKRSFCFVSRSPCYSTLPFSASSFICRSKPPYVKKIIALVEERRIPATRSLRWKMIPSLCVWS